jgi:transglutaminase-like putative cysteine protease
VLTDGGRKSGWNHVVWSKSTWNGHETVLDVTTAHSRRTRQMLSIEDVFESTSEQRTERGLDGAYYRSTSRSTDKGGQVVTSEVTWTGSGYDSVVRVAARVADESAGTPATEATEERHHADATSPAHVDAEALVSAKAAAGALKVGDRFVRRELNLAAERVDEKPVVVAADEEVETPAGRVRAWKLVESDPRTGGETYLWIDREGAVVRLKELSFEVRRVASKAEAERRWGLEPKFSITAEARPQLPRIFSAERLEIEVGISPDPDRPRPEFPDSPWSRTLAVEGDAASGWKVRMALAAYDAPDAHATIPVKDPAFAKDLEPTLLMPCLHPDVKGAASRAVAGETDARKAALRIADFVFSLAKEPPDEAGATALDILRERKGYCNEHALLFVALCRAAGIPARRCSGFVCIGDDWGAHAWAEIWVGAWMGVDPTTDDVGTAARYLFFGYSDDPNSHTGTVSARAQGRLSFTGRALDEGADHVDLTDAASLRRFDEARRVAVDRLAGFEARDLPAGWSVVFARHGAVSLTGPDDESVLVRLRADQGYRSAARMADLVEGRRATFAGLPARLVRSGTSRTYLVGSRKRHVILTFSASSERLDALVATMEQVLAPTFAEPAVAPK